MRPCAGVPSVIGPLCTYRETQDGTYNLAEILTLNIAIEEAVDGYKSAVSAVNNGR